MSEECPTTGLLDVEAAAEATAAPVVTPVTPVSSHRWKFSLALTTLFGLVLYMSHQQPTLADVTKTVELASESSSIETCSKRFSELMEKYKTNQGQLRMGHFDYKGQHMTFFNITSGQDAAVALKDDNTNFIQLGNCEYQARAVVWFYPDASGDSTKAFLMADGECIRLATSALDKQANCAAIYRIPSPDWGSFMLNRFHGPETITHAVVGGHGGDSTRDTGYLEMSSGTTLSYAGFHGEGQTNSTIFVDTLHTKLTPRGTIFLDSCFGGINGVAKMFSERIPEHWVMGGVVSLTSVIQVHTTPFDGIAGPTQVTSEFWVDKVLNSYEPVKKKFVDDKPVFDGFNYVDGLALGLNKGQLSIHEHIQTKFGERIVAWFGGINRGSVTQFLYPSANGKVVKVGCKVKVVKPFSAMLMETAGNNVSAELAIFPQRLPEGLTGKVLFVNDVSNTPTSGTALIVYDLPLLLQANGITGQTGQTLGTLMTLAADFDKLDISCPSEAIAPAP